MNRAALRRLALDPGSPDGGGGGIVDRLAARIGSRAVAAVSSSVMPATGSSSSSRS